MSTDNLYQRVIEVFRKTGSVKKTVETVGTTLVRAQRILITEGLWSSPTSEKILDLYRKGKTVPEIAGELFISEKTVQAYLPYTRTDKGYGGDDRSTDAIKSEEYRGRMHRAAETQVSEAAMKMEREEKVDKFKGIRIIKDSEIVAARRANDKRIVENSKQENLSEFTTEELYSKHMVKRPEVLKLKLALDMKYVGDEEMEVLRKYGKVEKGITREILVPSSITLHALNYAILRAFGWQNGHLHKFSLPKEVFQKMTGGKNKVDKHGFVEYDGKFKNWVKLCGLYFRYPCEDFDDLYWDDDYEEGQSIKTWMRKKYTGPYRYKGEWEHYCNANAAANEDMIEHSLGNVPTVYDRIKFLIKQQEADDKDHSVLPVAHELTYEYDYGDGWEVKITLEDCYYTKNIFDAQMLSADYRSGDYFSALADNPYLMSFFSQSFRTLKLHF